MARAQGGTAEATEAPAEAAEGANGAPAERKPWTEEQKEAQRQRMLEYYKHNEHPMKGKPLSEEHKAKLKEARAGMVAIASCEVCGKPLYTEESATRGYGDECAKQVAAAGGLDALKRQKAEEAKAAEATEE